MTQIKTKLGEFIVDQMRSKKRENDRISIGIHYNKSFPKNNYDSYIKDIGKFEYFMKGATILMDSIGIAHENKIYDLTIEDFEPIGDFSETAKGYYHTELIAITGLDGKGKDLKVDQITKIIENIDNYRHLKEINLCNY
jgi:hypothetical protein